MQSTQLPVIAGVEITVDEHGRYNLNALHRAHLELHPDASRSSKQPADWLKLEQAKELIAEVSNSEDLRGLESVVTRSGRYGGTFTHELLAVSYAGWISPRFQLQVNQAFLDVRNGAARPSVAITNPEVAMLVELRDSGLISKDDARRAALSMIGLSESAPAPAIIIAEPALPALPRRKAPPKPANPSGEPTFNIGNDYLTLATLSCWVQGGVTELMRAMRDFNLIDAACKPTGKGVALSQRFGREWRYMARDTLKVIGAWPKR